MTSLALLPSILFACKEKTGHEASALGALITGASDGLIQLIEQSDQVRLADILKDGAKYGLNQTTIKSVRSSLQGHDLSKLVLGYIDPNKMKGKAAVHWAFIPPVPDDSLTKIEVLDTEGKTKIIDGTKSPEAAPYPIITLSYSEKLSIPQAAGATGLNLAENSGEGAMILKEYEMKNDHEPWIKGAAEIYAVVSFFDKEGNGRTELHELWAADHQKKKYAFNKILHNWRDNKFQYVNMTVFEHDSRHDYSALVKVFNAAVAGAIAIVDPSKASLPVVGLISTLTDKVIDALPKSALTDDDDFVDNLDILNKYSSTPHTGEMGNVTVSYEYQMMHYSDESK
jgi:hypothetical protein